MTKQKLYICDICHKKMNNKHIIRLVKMEYGVTGYNQFGQIGKYNVCLHCIKIFDKWINKHKEEK